jgi:hypothetical protein
LKKVTILNERFLRESFLHRKPGTSVYFKHLFLKMAKKGPNSKAEAGNAKKAAVKAEKDKKANAAAAAAEDAKWAKGSKSTNKKDDAEAKKVL